MWQVRGHSLIPNTCVVLTPLISLKQHDSVMNDLDNPIPTKSICGHLYSDKVLPDFWMCLGVLLKMWWVNPAQRVVNFTWFSVFYLFFYITELFPGFVMIYNPSICNCKCFQSRHTLIRDFKVYKASIPFSGKCLRCSVQWGAINETTI